MPKEAETSLTNWAGNFSYHAEHVVSPQSVSELQDIVRNSQRIKGLGSRHSFNSVADTSGTLVSSVNLNRIIDLDADNNTVAVEPGVTYGQLCPYLDEHGFALPNLASLPHITVVGSCMTGTHGSGVKNGNLATSVTALEFVAADGSLHTVTSDEDRFAGMVVGLGAFGIISKITLNVIPAYEMWQQVFPQLPLTTALDNYDEIVNSAYSVSLFTSWQHAHIDQVWIKERANQPPIDTFFGTTAATSPMHPLPDGDVQACTEQIGKVGRWYDRLPHFRMGFQPSSGREIQSEYFVGIESAVKAIQALREIQTQFSNLLFISELRTIAADDLWLSPCFGRTSIGIHFTWKPDQERVEAVLPIIEKALMRFGVRPHWGKVHTLDPDYVKSQYEQFPAFSELVRTYDPDGKFSNTYLSRYI